MSYKKKILNYGHSTTVGIPTKVCKDLGIEKGDTVEVEILRVIKPTEAEANAQPSEDGSTDE